MLVINCPFCGPRDEREFDYCGPAGELRPACPDAVDDADWVEYLTVPNNPLGLVKEYWWHVRGCRAWVHVSRNTLTHEIVPSDKESIP